VILVGDHKQLPPSINHVSSLVGFGVSLFARLAKIVNPFLLTTQYRSHPLIMSISSDLFYEGRLENGVSPVDRPPLPGFPWKKCENHKVLPVAFVPCTSYESASNTSKSNSAEASVVVELVKKFIKSGVPTADIGVISAYSGQNLLMKKMFASQNITGLEINSVDAYQGREKELIIFSATRSNSYGQVGFLSDPRRFNVMHTRAKRGLVVVGNRETLSTDKTWAKWFEWIDRHNLTVDL
jgi:superfamily I DNA and/or RNA helicase